MECYKTRQELAFLFFSYIHGCGKSSHNKHCPHLYPSISISLACHFPFSHLVLWYTVIVSNNFDRVPRGFIPIFSDNCHRYKYD